MIPSTRDPFELHVGYADSGSIFLARQVWMDMMVDGWQVVGRLREGVLRLLEE
jgi:hypothetical protein